MTVRLRSTCTFVIATAVATLLAAPLRAQEGLLVPPPAPAPAPVPTAAAPAAPSHAAPAPAAGPTVEAAAVGARQLVSSTRESNAAAPRGGRGQPVALIVVGGAAILAGLIIGGGAGYAIAVGGAVIGLVGLYQYLQ